MISKSSWCQRAQAMEEPLTRKRRAPSRKGEHSVEHHATKNNCRHMTTTITNCIRQGSVTSKVRVVRRVPSSFIEQRRYIIKRAAVKKQY